MRAEPVRVRHRHPGPPDRTFEAAGDVAVGEETQPPPFGEPQPDPLHGGWGRVGGLPPPRECGAGLERGWARHDPTCLTTVSGNSVVPLGPTSMSVPVAGQTPQSKHGVQRQSSCSRPSSASCQSSQSQSRSSPESR